MDIKYIAAIDLGSSKIALSIAKVTGENIEILYYSQTPAEGIRKSIVSNPRNASEQIRGAILEAEDQLKIKIRQVVVGLPRYYVFQETATGKIERINPDEYITREEIDILKSIAMDQYPLDNTEKQYIYGVVAQSFQTEDEIQLSEEDVIGAISPTVAGNFKIFIGERRSISNLDKIFNDMSIAIAKKYFLPYISSKSVLSEEEKENGVALVDFGSEVTSVVIFSKGIMRYYNAIPFGGNNISKDIRIISTISGELAENIKLAYGSCMADRLGNFSDKTLQIRYKDYQKEIPLKTLAKIIEAREREIVDAILFSIQESNLKEEIRSGIVITGGGANMLNLPNLIKEMSHGYHVRVGYPKQRFLADGIEGIGDPAAANVIGMILAARDDALPSCFNAPPTIPVYWPGAVETVPVAPEPATTEEEPEEVEKWDENVTSWTPETEKPEEGPQAEEAQQEEEEAVQTVEVPAGKPRKEKPEKPRKVSQKTGPSKIKIFWTKIAEVGNTMSKKIGNIADVMYEAVTEEVDEK